MRFTCSVQNLNKILEAKKEEFFRRENELGNEKHVQKSDKIDAFLRAAIVTLGQNIHNHGVNPSDHLDDQRFPRSTSDSRFCVPGGFGDGKEEVSCVLKQMRTVLVIG